MALEMGMNLVCSVLEEVVMCVCQYLFMSANAQTIHRKKIWYFFGFTALGASVYGAAFLTGLTGNTDPADRGAASWNFIVSQKNRKSAPGSFCKHPFDSFHRSGDFSGELPACTGGV